jgi:hypothetical protein
MWCFEGMQGQNPYSFQIQLPKPITLLGALGLEPQPSAFDSFLDAIAKVLGGEAKGANPAYATVGNNAARDSVRLQHERNYLAMRTMQNANAGR